MKHISPTFMYNTNVFEPDNVFKNPTLKVISPIFLAILISLRAPPMTAGALTDPQLPSIASNVCTTDAMPGGVGRVPPKQKSWLRRCLELPESGPYSPTCFPWHHAQPLTHMSQKSMSEDSRKTLLPKQTPKEAGGLWHELGHLPVA